MLRSVALSDVGLDDHYVELDELMTAHYTEADRTSQMDAIRAMADVVRLLQSENDSANDVHAELVACADRFESMLLATDFVDDDPVWWTRWFAMHARIAEWAEWADTDSDQWVRTLEEAASRMATRLGLPVRESG